MTSQHQNNVFLDTNRLQTGFVSRVWYDLSRSRHYTTHRLSINRPTKRGKENSRSDGHRQCEKEMEDYCLACQ
jgi:hypothetical protein